MHKRTIIYRGYLKSCNYRCSYCPFSKHMSSPAMLEKDRLSLTRFCGSIEERTQPFSIGAVFLTPYGEASLHRWYWEGLARLSGIAGIDRVGLQTNLSFPVEKSLRPFDSSQREKLCIWATFHPEMTSVRQFVSQCREVRAHGVRICAGAVGVPQNLPIIRKLRERLSPDIYLWINKMGGLGRNYTEDEIGAFSEIDPFFGHGLKTPAADGRMCRDRCFVEADGKIRTCNISRVKRVNWYGGTEEEIFEPLCGVKRCSCYLAYGGRADFELRDIFGDYPLFRIPDL